MKPNPGVCYLCKCAPALPSFTTRLMTKKTHSKWTTSSPKAPHTFQHPGWEHGIEKIRGISGCVPRYSPLRTSSRIAANISGYQPVRCNVFITMLSLSNNKHTTLVHFMQTSDRPKSEVDGGNTTSTERLCCVFQTVTVLTCKCYSITKSIQVLICCNICMGLSRPGKRTHTHTHSGVGRCGVGGGGGQ